MTSSARSRIDGGTSRPSAVAVLRFHGHLVFRGQLYREIARLLAAQNAIHIGGGATKAVYEVDSVGEQAVVSGKDRWRIDRRYVVAGRRQYGHAMRDQESTRLEGRLPARAQGC